MKYSIEEIDEIREMLSRAEAERVRLHERYCRDWERAHQLNKQRDCEHQFAWEYGSPRCSKCMLRDRRAANGQRREDDRTGAAAQEVCTNTESKKGGGGSNEST